MRIPKLLFVAVLLSLVAGGANPSAQLTHVFPNTPEVQQADHVLEKKAPLDECWAGLYSGIAQFTNPNSATPPCSNVVAPTPTAPMQPKVNQGYIWGLTETATHAWYGTFANGQCVTQAGVVGDPTPFVTDAYVCEFAASPYVPSPLPSGLIGDFRPPRGYQWNKSTGALVDVTPKRTAAAPAGYSTATNPEGIFPLWAVTRGIRAATTIQPATGDPIVILAGPNLDPTQGISLFAWNATTGAFLGGRRVLGYSNIRHFTIVDGVLYTGVGKNQCTTSGTPPVTTCTSQVIGGRVLRLGVTHTSTCSTAFPPPQTTPPTPNIWNPLVPCWNVAVQEVANLDSVAAYIVKHTDNRIYISTWPEADMPGSLASVFMSPELPVGGLTTAHAALWTKVWTATDYEPDPITALTYAGGALASFDGHLYWGSMHIPWQAMGAFMKVHCPNQVNEPEPFPCSREQVARALAGTMRSVAIFRGRDFTTAPQIELLYGDNSLPVFDTTVGTPGTWVLKPNQMNGGAGAVSKYGPSGFGNIWNTYTWTMSVWNNVLYIGTMDWAFLSKMGSQLLGASLPPDLYNNAKFGGDLMYIAGANSPAVPESTNGNGNPTSYGIRTMVPGGGVLGPNLTLGIANPMNLLTDPADPKGFGGLGGWELISMKPKAGANTGAGTNVAVSLANGITVNYCNVARAGNTVAAYLPSPFEASPSANLWWVQRYDLDGPSNLSTLATTSRQWVYLGSTADWRTGCASPVLATVCVPRPAGVNVPRVYELTWTGTGYALGNITTSASETEVCGGATEKSLGAFLFAGLDVSVELAPAISVVRPGTQHTATATVRNPANEGVSGVQVTFGVTGGNTRSAYSAISDANGVATFTYADTSAPPYPQIDTVTASVGTASRQATVVWVLTCDADSDKDIDMADLNLIRAASGKLASGPYDPRDANKDKVINGTDLRTCQLRMGQ